MKRNLAVLWMWLLCVPGLLAQQVAVEEYVLPNGMRLLMVPKKGDPNVAAGWIARVGSVNERQGITGISHLLEHMMFKGTRAIGTADIKRDLRLMAEMDAVKAEIGREERAQIERLRLGLISDLAEPGGRSGRHAALLEEFARLEAEAAELIVRNEFARIYTHAGASGMNAGTGRDYTVYFINVPANKLELWFWMESDRLLNPVFREFYPEREVVQEERRLTVDSTPTGRIEEQFDALFFSSSPYAWPVIGWPSDLGGITREEAEDYFKLHYAANNLSACLVGDFDPAEARRLADRYFGRLRPNPRGRPEVRTREIEQTVEKRMTAYAETFPQVEVRYHSVADGHVDEPALLVMGALLSGRTGRLHKALVLDRKIANSVSAGQNGMKYEGFFSLGGVAKPESSPEEVERALYAEIERLQREPVGERELEKVKNRFAADNLRRMENRLYLMLQLLVADSNRGWESFNEDPRRVAAVTAEDVRRVANRYFRPENRAVALYYTKETEAAADPLLEGLDPQARAEIVQFKGVVARMGSEEARAILEKVRVQEGSAPPEKRAFVAALIRLLEERIAQEGGR